MYQIVESRCTGCRTCELVCALEHYREVDPKKSALRIVPCFPEPGHYRIKFCDQCGDCVEVCTVEALVKQGEIVRLVVENCNGCMACVAECDQGVLFQHPAFEHPIKCDWCGKCVEICPPRALMPPAP